MIRIVSEGRLKSDMHRDMQCEINIKQAFFCNQIV